MTISLVSLLLPFQISHPSLQMHACTCILSFFLLHIKLHTYNRFLPLEKPDYYTLLLFWCLISLWFWILAATELHWNNECWNKIHSDVPAWLVRLPWNLMWIKWTCTSYIPYIVEFWHIILYILMTSKRSW